MFRINNNIFNHCYRPRIQPQSTKNFPPLIAPLSKSSPNSFNYSQYPTVSDANPAAYSRAAAASQLNRRYITYTRTTRTQTKQPIIKCINAPSPSNPARARVAVHSLLRIYTQSTLIPPRLAALILVAQSDSCVRLSSLQQQRTAPERNNQRARVPVYHHKFRLIAL